MRKSPHVMLGLVASAVTLTAGAAFAGAGWGEQPPVPFKSPTEEQVDLNKERARLDYNALKGAGMFDDLNGGGNGGNGGGLGGTNIGGGGIISGNAQSAANSLNDAAMDYHLTITVDGDGNDIIVQTYQDQTQTADDIDQSNLNSQVTGVSPVEILNQ